MKIQVDAKFETMHDLPNIQIIEGLKLKGLSNYFATIDPASLVGKEIETRLVCPTVVVRRDQTGKYYWNALVEIDITEPEPINVTEFWQDDETLEAMYDWYCAQSTGTM